MAQGLVTDSCVGGRALDVNSCLTELKPVGGQALTLQSAAIWEARISAGLFSVTEISGFPEYRSAFSGTHSDA